MDSQKPLDAEAEDWLWSLPWAMAPECDWSAVVGCLRGVARAELGERWRQHYCAEWADLIEALAPAQLEDGVAGQPRESLAMKAECH